MKKSIFLFFAAILCAMTANAQLYLRGGFNNWNDLTADYQFVSNVCNLELPGGTTYEFKIADSSWGTNFGGNHTFEATATKTLTSGGGNMTIKTTIPGTYKFEFVQSTKKLTVTYPEIPAPHDITVRAKLPATWTESTISAWVWTSEDATGSDVIAEKDGDYYKITKNAGALYVVFRNGAGWNGDKNQTVDLCYTEDVCLQLNQSGEAKATATVIDCGAVAKDITVKAVVPGAWENTITAWVWPTGGEGKEVTPTKDGNWYVVTENCIELNVIFKNGTGWNGNENQTVNIEGVTENICYQISALTKVDGKCSVTEADCDAVIEPEAKPEPTPTYDYYITGTFNGWNEKDPAHGMTLDGEVYKATVTLAAGENLVKVTDGTWAGAKGYSAMGAEYNEVSQGASDDNIKVDLTEGKEVVVVYNATTEKVTFEGLTEKAPAPTFDYYITGSFNGNNPKKAENGMTLDGTVYKATVTLAAGDNTLKVTKGSWDPTWGYTELGAAYEEVSNPNDYNNIKITLAAEKEITVIFDATAGKITFDGLTPYVAPLTYTVTVPAGTEKCYIAGNMNGWAFQEMEAVTGETNKFTITIVGAKETDEYKYACQADWAYAEVIDGGGNRTHWSELDEVTAWNKPVVYTYYLMGVDGDWTTGIEMEVNTDAENEVMLTCQPVNGEVKIKRLGDDASEYWYGGKSLKDEAGNLGTNTEAATDGDGNILLEEGIYNFYFNTADGKLWIATATDCETEPVYGVVEDVITNFVFDMEAWPMVCMGGPSTNYKIEVYLTLTEDADGTLAYEGCFVSINGTDATFIDGTLSNIDPGAPYADAVLRVQMGEEYYELHLAMSSTPAEPITIEAEDATVTLTEYPANFEATEFAYELAMVANWVNEAESLPYTVEFVIPTFDPTKASGEYLANFWVTGEGDAFGMNENVSVTVTKDGNNVTLTGNVSALNGNAYNVTISGTIPDYTRAVTENQWGTICLPKASSSFTGATFYEVSSFDPAKGLWLDQLEAGAQLEAGKPYIFYATATEIAVVYTGAAKSAPVAGANGLTGTFTDIAAGGALVGNYIIAENKVWVAGESATLPANRAYIANTVPTTEQPKLPGRRRVCMGENAATGLDQIVAPEGQAVKAIVNGQLIIIRDGVKYNVQGQLVK